MADGGGRGERLGREEEIQSLTLLVTLRKRVDEKRVADRPEYVKKKAPKRRAMKEEGGVMERERRKIIEKIKCAMARFKTWTGVAE